MMDLVNDPGSFVVGCGIGFFAGVTFRLAVHKFKEAWSELKEAKELDTHGNGANGHA